MLFINCLNFIHFFDFRRNFKFQTVTYNWLMFGFIFSHKFRFYHYWLKESFHFLKGSFCFWYVANNFAFFKDD